MQIVHIPKSRLQKFTIAISGNNDLEITDYSDHHACKALLFQIESQRDFIMKM